MQRFVPILDVSMFVGRICIDKTVKGRGLDIIEVLAFLLMLSTMELGQVSFVFLGFHLPAF